MKLYSTAAYLIAALVVGTLLAALNVLVWGNFDPKFQDAMELALRIELLGNVLVALFGSGILLLGMFFLRFESQAPKSILIASGFGAGYPIVLYLVLNFGSSGIAHESVVPAFGGWLAIVAWPAIAAFTVKRGKHGQSLP